MYIAIIFLLIGISALFIGFGIKKKSLVRIIFGAILGIFTILLFSVLDLWGEALWFQAIGYGERFWTVLWSEVGFTIVGGVISLFVVYLLTLPIPSSKRYLTLITVVIGAIIGGNWGLANWDKILIFLNKVSTSVNDPILGKNSGFYLFSLPFYDEVYSLLLSLSIISLIAAFIAVFFRFRKGEIEFTKPEETEDHPSRRYFPMYLNSAILLFVLAIGKFLARYHLMYSTWGAVSGAGWTDVHVRLPMYIVTVIITLLLGIFLILPPLRNLYQKYFIKKFMEKRGNPHFATIISVVLVLIGSWIVLLGLVPNMFQWLRVEPNEITFEKPYISHNIDFTRKGFKLDKVEEREFPASAEFTQTMVNQNRNVFSNIRLWDWRALDAVYKQFQEIRLYYEFVDVDIDRYRFNDEYRQVMVSARELRLSNLPAQSQTFVNRRFKYTHGYGITLTNVSEFTPQGLPNLLVKDIPPKSKYPSLNVDIPQIYYGELTNSYVIANSQEEEFDYPKGEENVYTHYVGDGGVPVSNLWRKFIYGWKFDGTKFLVSSYINSDSRIMFHRQIQERVKKVAPFLHFDDDPYVVLIDGKLHWIIDAYTTSKYYPYSEPFSSREMIEYRQGKSEQTLYTEVTDYLHGINYIRNSVKVVVDAYSGETDLYIFDKEDPLIQVWQNIFPDLFKSREEMSEELFQHVRYPSNMLLVQGLVFAKYHMTDPTVFYNQEDLWIRATEKYYNQVQPVEPYYIMWELPDSDEQEFVLMLPFTPKKRQVLIGWIAGMCDEENYGRFLAYKFPKEKRVLGTQQVETKIDQDRFLSGQLTLWDQRGSNVIRGNVLVIPIEETIIYVEPIYLQAETAAYPELRLVVVMHEDDLSYAETFDEALRGLFKEGEGELPAEGAIGKKITFEELINQANSAFEEYLQYLGGKRYQDASDALEELEKTLQQLSEQAKTNPSTPK
jgi:hypothetical protein